MGFFFSYIIYSFQNMVPLPNIATLTTDRFHAAPPEAAKSFTHVTVPKPVNRL